MVFLSHQLELGSFLGAWLGGYAYDVFGFYDLVWMAAIAFGLAAIFLHWPIFDAPVQRMAGTKA